MCDYFNKKREGENSQNCPDQKKRMTLDVEQPMAVGYVY